MRARGSSTTTTTRARRLGGAAILAALMFVFASSAQADLATPKIATFTSPAAAVGAALNDNAVVTGGSFSPKPTGTVTFNLYDVTDPKCAGTPVFTSTVKLDLPTPSAPFTAVKSGTYSWIATYNGDALNNKVSSKCADPGETVAVSPATPTVTTTASGSVSLGGTITDSAVVGGGYKPSGTVTFKAFGPTDPTCASPPVFTSTVNLGTSTVSVPYTPTVAGTYRFIATYNGDTANSPAGSACGDAGESVVVTPAGVTPGTSPCNPGKMAQDLAHSLVAALTGTPGSAFQATCSAGVRIVLRAKEIRPGNPGIPHRDGFTTMANTLTHSTNSGQIAFTLNPQGVALRNYATSHGTSLVVFAIVHIRPDKTSVSSEAIQIFNLQ